MLNIIKNNPFRIVGTSANAKLKDRIANLSKIKAYSKVGKDLSFPYDLEQYLEKPDRTQISTEAALSKLNLADELVKYSLFWIYTITPTQQEGADNLAKNKITSAKRCYNKEANFGSLLSLATISFIKNNNTQGIEFLSKFLNDQHAIDEFVTMVSDINGQPINLNQDILFNVIFDNLLVDISSQDLLKIYNKLYKIDQNPIYEHSIKLLKNKESTILLTKLKNILENATHKYEDTPEQGIEHCSDVIKEYKLELRKVTKHYGKESAEYQTSMDKLAEFIINTVVAFIKDFNSHSPTYMLDLAIDLMKKAKTFAFSASIKSTCQSNIDSFKQLRRFSELGSFFLR